MNEKTSAEPESVIFVKEVTPEQKAILDKILIELIKEERFYEPPSISKMMPQGDMTDEEWQDDYSFWCD